MRWENNTGNDGKILPGDGKIFPKHGKILPPNKVMNKVFKKVLRRARNKFHAALLIKIKNCRVTGFLSPNGRHDINHFCRINNATYRSGNV